jgi:uncharacterized protein (TIGR03790 family)
MLALAALVFAGGGHAETLSAGRLGVIFNEDDAASAEVAAFYAAQRAIPPANVQGVHVAAVPVLSPEAFKPLRDGVLDRLPAAVQSLLLVWSRPYAVGCMSITTAFAAGYRAGFCEPGCKATTPSPLFNASGWLPADTVGWWPAMLLPADDVPLAKALIQRGVAADGSRPPGTLYLVRTSDAARNVRAAAYPDLEALFAQRLHVVELAAPVGSAPDTIGYFTGAASVEELPRIRFRPGALADHLTSSGGVLDGGRQMPATSWLRQGATASYGAVTEPCNIPAKFPNIGVLFEHYLHGETALEAYWKSVAMPGQGLIVGEPLARPYGVRGR